MVKDLIVHEAPTLPGVPVRHVWMSFLFWVERTGAPVGDPVKECCGCHRKVTASETYSVMPVDGNDLVCGPGYLFCGSCRVGEDPSHAYGHADRDWNTAHSRKRRPVVDVDLDEPIGL